jgi:hypothetical protein
MAYKVTGFDIIDDTRRIINASVVGVGTTIATTGSTKLYVEGASFTSGIATALRFFSNVAQGTAPISVASSTRVDTLNVQYFDNNDSSFYRNASNLNAGAVPAAQVTQSNGLVVSGNLNVSGNITIGGSITQTTVSQVRVSDRDITLGITTDANGNDISTDITANHGGISIASTVGSPIINIPTDAVNTDPSTYKQIMWIKQGHYSGLGTDAWVFNYGVSIGNTASVQNGSRLTVGAGFTVFDTYLDATDIRARHINATGVVTSGNHNLLTGSSYQINGTSVLNATTLGSGVVNSSLTSVGTLGSLNVTGTTNLGFVTATSAFVSGVVTSGNHNLLTGSSYQINGTSVLNATTLGSGVVNSSLTSVGTLGFLNVGNVNSTGIVTAVSFKGDGSQLTNITASGIGATSGITIRDEGVTVGTAGSVISLNFVGGNIVATASGIAATITISDNLVGTALSISGISTFSGIATHTASLFGTQASFTGVHTASTYYVGTTKVLDTVNSQVSITGIQTIDATTKATFERELAFAPNQFDDLSVTGISTFTNGPILIGTATSTGTASQVLQVGSAGATRGAYVSGNLGIGTTNPSQNLDINGNLRLRAFLYDGSNAQGTTGQFLSVTGTGVSWTTISGVSAGAISTAARAQSLDVVSTNTQTGGILFASAGNGQTVYNDTDLTYSSVTNTLTLNNAVVGSAVTINSSGISVSGIITATDFNSSSDKTLKHDIQVIQNPIEKVLQLNGVSFNWNDTGKPSVGVIAQEVEQVLPELVSNTDPKSVNYNGLIGLLIECVKDQQKQIDELKQNNIKKSGRRKSV